MNTTTTATNTTEATSTWGDVWEAATAASQQTAENAADWVRENPKTAATAAVAVGVGIGYLLFG